MATTITHTQISFCLNNELIEQLRTEAKKSAIVVSTIWLRVFLWPLLPTINRMRQLLQLCVRLRHRKNLETLDLDNFRSFVASL